MTRAFILAALLIAAPALSQMPGMPDMPMGHGPACTKPVIVPGFEGWAGAPAKVLTIGTPAALTLPDAASVNFSPALARPAPAGSFGGVFPLTIAKAGTYSIALGAGVWIDVILDGEKQKPIDHAHGTMCSGIAKIVSFTLQPGAYQVQFSEAKGADLKAMVIAK